jgi:hypothetical protein
MDMLASFVRRVRKGGGDFSFILFHRAYVGHCQGPGHFNELNEREPAVGCDAVALTLELTDKGHDNSRWN